VAAANRAGAVLARAVEPHAGEADDGHTHESNCLNCGAKLLGDFCHECGQRAHVHRSLKGFFHDLLHGVLHFEGKIWRTMAKLIGNPGDLTRRYIDGERAKFVSPVALFLFTVFLMFAVLVLLFRSFFKPIVILAALPLAVGGAFIGLLAFNLSLSIPSLIGFLMLMGLAAKNSILLVEYAIEREREGMSQHDALIEACRERARPIVMTTVAMAAGMLPTALGLGEGSETQAPLATAVVGGLMTSTLLTLFVVPVFYTLLDDAAAWARRRLGGHTALPAAGDGSPAYVPGD
jgi:hypothetical protein